MTGCRKNLSPRLNHIADSHNAPAEDAALLGALAWHLTQSNTDSAKTPAVAEAPQSRWKLQGRAEQVERFPEK